MTVQCLYDSIDLIILIYKIHNLTQSVFIVIIIIATVGLFEHRKFDKLKMTSGIYDRAIARKPETEGRRPVVA